LNGQIEIEVNRSTVLTETAYFLREEKVDVEAVFQLLDRGLRRQHRRPDRFHHSHGMDLADATIVVMSELHPRSQVLTIDRKDFAIYRRNDRQVIDFVAPPLRSKRSAR
jgi:predicted nucleic acid-binding protein